MHRYFFEVSYNGTRFNGWQTQLNGLGVQQVLEEALSKVLRAPITIVGSGRTDTGVHCRKQFFHVDLVEVTNSTALLQNLNALLPREVALHKMLKVHPLASARYDATARQYEYIITRKKNPLLVGLAWHCFKTLDVETMNKAAALLVGMHDFECFSKVKTDVNHFVCTVKKAEWTEKGDLLVFRIAANRFLRGMVRAIVGTLVDVGSGKISIAQFKGIIESKNRKNAGMNVPPEGLYLMDVRYPKRIFIA